MAETAPLSVDTKTVDVDIELLQKQEVNVEKEDSSLDTLPTSCDSSEDQPSNSCDADSVGESLGPPSESPIATGELRRVSFRNVEIRVFPRMLGDNPSVAEGPPLALGMKHCHFYTKDIDEYEKQRDEEIEAKLVEFYTRRGRLPPVESPHSSSPRRRRKPFEFNIPCRERIMILHWECSPQNEEAQAAGTVCTGADIKRVIRETQKTKRQRQTSKALREFEDLQVNVEKCQRKMKKLLKSRRQSKQESKLAEWANSSMTNIGVESQSESFGSDIKSILKAGCGEFDGEVAV